MNKSKFNLARILWDNGIHYLHDTCKNQWVQVGILSVLLFLISQKDMNFKFSLGNNTQTANILDTKILYGTPFGMSGSVITQLPPSINASATRPNTKLQKDQNSDIEHNENSLNLANEATAVGAALTDKEMEVAAKLSNLSVVFNSDEYFRKKNIPTSVVNLKKKKCEAYIYKYAKTAQEEADIYNIPACITLAQGLLESNAGDSKLATRENNHFGIKCKAKCLGCRCANYTDDDKYDMFRIFESPWHSFREHSKLLSGERYQYLKKIDKKDYKNWARGLKAAGYATDKNYAEKLIKIIEFFDLQKYDL